MFDYDDKTKDTLTTGEVNTIFSDLILTSLNVTGPALTLLGNNDVTQCGDLPCDAPDGTLATEADYWPLANWSYHSYPSTGHSLNYHLSAPAVYLDVMSWLDQKFGSP